MTSYLFGDLSLTNEQAIDQTTGLNLEKSILLSFENSLTKYNNANN